MDRSATDHCRRADTAEAAVGENCRTIAKLEKELAQIRTTLQNGLDRDIDDTTTPHLAVVAINALAQAKESRTWIPLAERKPTWDDVNENGDLLGLMHNRKPRIASYESITIIEPDAYMAFLPLPKLSPPAVDPDEAAFENIATKLERRANELYRAGTTDHDEAIVVRTLIVAYHEIAEMLQACSGQTAAPR